MQLGTDVSTSQVENNFIGTGFVFVTEHNLPPPSAAIFFALNVYLRLFMLGMGVSVNLLTG